MKEFNKKNCIVNLSKMKRAELVAIAKEKKQSIRMRCIVDRKFILCCIEDVVNKIINNMKEHITLPEYEIIAYEDGQEVKNIPLYTTKHNEADAFRVMQRKANADGKRYKLVSDDGRLIDLIG